MEPECPVCLGALQEASLLPGCGHSFCMRCIESLPAEGSGTPCPVSAAGPPAWSWCAVTFACAWARRPRS